MSSVPALQFCNNTIYQMLIINVAYCCQYDTDKCHTDHLVWTLDHMLSQAKFWYIPILFFFALFIYIFFYYYLLVVHDDILHQYIKSM